MTSRSRIPIALVAILLSTFFLAGCIGKDGEVEARSINLAYEGSESGTHQTTGACDSEGTLTGQGVVTDGSVRLQVLDGSGNSRFDKTYTTDFQVQTVDVAGASGTWKIIGSRTGNDLVGDAFQGSYSLTQRC